MFIPDVVLGRDGGLRHQATGIEVIVVPGLPLWSGSPRTCLSQIWLQASVRVGGTGLLPPGKESLCTPPQGLTAGRVRFPGAACHVVSTYQQSPLLLDPPLDGSRAEQGLLVGSEVSLTPLCICSQNLLAAPCASTDTGVQGGPDPTPGCPGRLHAARQSPLPGPRLLSVSA